MKQLFIVTLALLLAQPAFAQESAAPDGASTARWQSAKIDGHRTGVTAPTQDNVREALGSVEKGVYTAPNGRRFKKGATPAVAALMIEAQAPMAPVKETIGYAPKEMRRYGPQCELSNWFTDFLRAKTAELTGKPVDVAIYNSGGIRTDMPQGDITVDDIMSMFPFRNSLCYVALKGADLRAIFQQLASTRLQPFSGAKMTVRDGKIESLTVGGAPIDDKKVYGVTTINFLLTGGDGLFIARNALELIDSGVMVKDAVIPYIKSLTLAGKAVEGALDDRIVVLDPEKKEE